MKTTFLLIISLSLVFQLTAQNQKTEISVDLNKFKGEMTPIWAWFGYDEPNYTYMKDGKKLLAELAALSPAPVHVRAHNLMCTGNGTAALKWGSTNMYTEDEAGNPVYYWKVVDSIFDAYINLKMKPLAEIGFMPEALSTNMHPYQHSWKPGVNYNEVYTGWAYPPNNYEKWAELIYQWVLHCVDRYGKEEVESWYWELWNEPDIGYLQSENRLETFCKMYDFASDAVKRALPSAKMGGPNSTGGAMKFLDGFIRHCLTGKNAATGGIGAPLDFVAFHAKGWPTVVDGVVRMGMMNQLRNVNDNLEVIASFPETRNLPVIIGESDPEGCAACGMNTNPENAYRNGTMYSSYTAASISRIYDLNDYYKTNLIGAVNWSFEFENQLWFQGFRDLATNGVDKPVLNLFRMFGMMSGKRVEVSGNMSYNVQSILQSGVREKSTDINALASNDKNSAAVLLWNYHDDDIQDEGSSVALTLRNIPAKKGTLSHYRIDSKHSNSYEVWKEMGSPQNPTQEQYIKLEQSGQLEMFGKPQNVKIKNSELKVEMQLPRQAVSLIKLEY
jgi:xylan 1,4-beta-xylosidase